MMMRIVNNHRQLVRHIFHIMTDKRKMLSVISQLLCFPEGQSVPLFGNMSCRLTCDNPQNVESLAGKLQWGTWSDQNDKTDQLIASTQRHRQPRVRDLVIPLR